MQEDKKQINAIFVWKTLCKFFVAKTFFLQKQKWTNLTTYSFFYDDSELHEDEEVLLGEFPTFSVQFNEYFDSFSSTSAPGACDPESSNKETNPEPTQKVQNVDSTRFPEISSEEIEELKAVAVNKNTSRSTKQWMNIFKSWCQSRHLENVNIETMALEELDNILSKFYAEVKERDGDDYEPESLKGPCSPKRLCALVFLF